MPLSAETRRRALGIILALDGALILVGAVLLGISASNIFPIDTFVGTNASVAAIVLGAGLVLAYRAPSRMWVNLAIMYNALTVVAQFWNGADLGVQKSSTATIVSVVFLVLFAVLYPRGESMEMAGSH